MIEFVRGLLAAHFYILLDMISNKKEACAYFACAHGLNSACMGCCPPLCGLCAPMQPHLPAFQSPK